MVYVTTDKPVGDINIVKMKKADLVKTGNIYDILSKKSLFVENFNL